MSTYQPGVPTGTVDLDVDYINIQNNFTQANTSFGVDHVPFDTNTPDEPAGYHEAVHFVPISTIATRPPNNQPLNAADYTATPGFGQVFSAQINDGINVDQSLYFLTGGNRLTQLTRNFQPVASANGYTFLPGGLILQWGTFDPNSSTSVTFSTNGGIAFPNAAFNIQFTGAAANNSTFRSGLSTGTLSATGFTWEGTINANWTPIYYMAIGN